MNKLEVHQTALLAVCIQAYRQFTKCHAQVRDYLQCQTVLLIHEKLMMGAMEPEQVPEQYISLLMDIFSDSTALRNTIEYYEEMDIKQQLRVAREYAYETQRNFILEIFPGFIMKSGKRTYVEKLIEEIPFLSEHDTWEYVIARCRTLMLRMMRNTCRQCGSSIQMTRRCRDCGKLLFCSRGCQEADRRDEIFGHKNEC